MLKHIYRIIILIVIFVGAIYYFSRDIKEVVFHIDNTTVMEETTFPLVSMKAAEEKINLLRGYSSNINANLLREAVTPLNKDQTFIIEIDQKSYDIKKLNYELREFVDNILIETDSISVFEEQNNVKSAAIKLKTELETDKEYAVKITLISSNSKKIYFYQRVKVFDNAYLSEKLEFAMDFHKAIQNKDTAQTMIKYLEPKRSMDNSSLAYVNINSSFDLVTWGNLKPIMVTDIIPTIKEIHLDTAIIELNYIIKEEVVGTYEYYQVNEYFRVRYTRDRMYLLNYERRMDAFFDTNLVSLSKNQFKLGISNDVNVPSVVSDDQKRIAFVRNRELWLYQTDDNQMIRIFSFRQDNTDYIRDIYNQHDIKIINMDQEGNMDFLVYGYMNRGQYEGRVAIILYQYIRAENRIEELVYIPVDEPYQMLKENMGDIAYVNGKDVFYFHIFHNLYSYNLITKELTEIAVDITKEDMVVWKDINYVVWHENTNPKLSKKIFLMNLDTGQKDTIKAPTGYNIRLLEKIDSNIIYGIVKEEDIDILLDGHMIVPMNQLMIASVNRKVLKEYKKSGYYVSDIEVRDNVVELQRVQKVNENGRTTFVPTAPDYIMNQVKAKTQHVEVVNRVTDFALTELYLSLPKTVQIAEVPKVVKTINTVITTDPTVRLHDSNLELEYYYPYVYGGISGNYREASEAINVASKGIGVVLNHRQQIIWERGIRATKTTISDIAKMDFTQSSQSIESCIDVMLSLQGIQLNKEQLSVANRSIYEVLSHYSRQTPIRVTGITLEDALYYVSKGKPVLAMTDYRNAVLIYGYDAFNITVYDPRVSKERKIGLQDGTQLFKEAGNVFITVID